MLFRNLIYTGLTRAKLLWVFVGSRKALSMAVKQVGDSRKKTNGFELADYELRGTSEDKKNLELWFVGGCSAISPVQML